MTGDLLFREISRWTVKGRFFLFFFLWILPVVYVGTFNKMAFWLPGYLGEFSDVCRLFSREQDVFALYEVQVLFVGETEYRSIPEREYFKMNALGNRSRFQRIMDKCDFEIYSKLADWFKKRLEGKKGKKVVGIRYLEFACKVNEFGEEKERASGKKFKILYEKLFLAVKLDKIKIG